MLMMLGFGPTICR